MCCRDEATRTPDPYVPNVVRYQLRYIPIFCPIATLFVKRVQRYEKEVKSEKFAAAQQKLTIFLPYISMAVANFSLFTLLFYLI